VFERVKFMDFLNVDQVLQMIDVEEHMAAAEFGCGVADFAVALAKKLKNGRIYALDIQEEKLSVVRSRLALEKLRNVTTMLRDLEDSKGSTLQDDFLDIVVIPNLLFHAKNKYGIIEEAVRIIKPGGKILIVDWLKRSPFNSRNHVISPDEVKNMAGKLGLFLEKEFAAGDYHYALLFTKDLLRKGFRNET